MRNRVLVLNQDYSALTICSVERAFLLVFLNKAERVSDDRNHFLRSVSATFPVPSVIRLVDYVKLPFKGVMLSHQNVFKRDGYRCQYCGTASDLTLDHVYPRSRGGLTTWDNLITACKTCNSRKGDKTPDEARMPYRQKPYKPNFITFIRDLSGHVEEEWVTFLGQKMRYLN